ncbi:type VI secretion system Vgr family protein [Polyangium aurulentum]|uniref:type VI secretion system Vgr family protein n=1 Tax=Polyangium aurulentum TaxID=2567896 RepID=UPI0010AE3D2D|nr:type VI secretion system tip protein TssI/VgrG [Polyangium aurulentum]UQA57638.1 type VI secretion system tip protein VgrG [Polyangium aurulentum]
MSNADFELACEGVGSANPWDALRVARFSGREEISSLYRYEIIVLASPEPMDVAALVGKRATLRIATLSTPAYKAVHGVVTEAEEIAVLPEGRTLRLVLMPPWARATHRRRCRIFLEKTLREIIDAVLTGDPLVQKAGAAAPEPDLGGNDFSPAKETFAWRIEDASRLDSKRVRPFVVQYNESDFAFVSRLLEEEGIAYHVENGGDTSLLVLSDSDAGRPRLEPALVGAGIDGREVGRFFAGARLRPEAVVLGDYNWKQPGVEMVARAGGKSADLFEQVYPGGYPDEASQGKPLASALLERHKTEARFARGEGLLRVLSAGSILALEHHKARLEGEYLVTAIEVRAEQAGVLKSPAGGGMIEPFKVSFECARRGEGTSVQDSRFRPARVTPRPRILGSQTAVVTAEPSNKGAEIHVGGPNGINIGCVRLRFHWDTDGARLAKEPSSAWVRVNEPFAGSGMGGVWHPRVGTEVIVAFEEGDPDRPIVVGRVYNGDNRPHRGGSPTVSTFKSNASPGGGVHNEITFDDTAGAELIYTNAGKDMETDVGNNRFESVAANASMTVGGNDTEQIGANCTVTVGGDETVSVGGNDTSTIGGNCTVSIGANCTTNIGGSEVHVVGANQTITIGATHGEDIGGSVTETIGGTLTTNVAAAETENIGANRSTTIAGAHTQSFGATQTKDVGGNRELTCASLTTTVGASSKNDVGGKITTTVGGSHTLNAGVGAIFLTPDYTAQDGNRADVDASKIKILGLDLAIGGIQMSATGFASSMYGVNATAAGLKLSVVGSQVHVFGLLTHTNGGHIQLAGVKTRAGYIIKL